MKFEHILNSFNPAVTEIDLTEKRFLRRLWRNSTKSAETLKGVIDILNTFDKWKQGTFNEAKNKKDIEYIAMLISRVDRYRITEFLLITSSDIVELYKNSD